MSFLAPDFSTGVGDAPSAGEAGPIVAQAW
jgi:hypothetical protein